VANRVFVGRQAVKSPRGFHNFQSSVNMQYLIIRVFKDVTIDCDSPDTTSNMHSGVSNPS
jgi:hypothetical protein